MLEGEVVDEGEAHAAAQRLESFAEGGGPIALQWGRAENNNDVIGVGLELEDVIDQSFEIEVASNECGVLLQRARRQQALVHAVVDDGSGWEEAIAVPGHKPSGG